MKHHKIIVLLAIFLVNLVINPVFSQITGSSQNIIRELAETHIFSYAQELYQLHRYPEAAMAFGEILALNCHNSSARSYLEKIKNKAPLRTNAEKFLASTQCRKRSIKIECPVSTRIKLKNKPSCSKKIDVFNNLPNTQTNIVDTEDLTNWNTQDLQTKLTNIQDKLKKLQTSILERNQKIETMRRAILTRTP